MVEEEEEEEDEEEDDVNEVALIVACGKLPSTEIDELEEEEEEELEEDEEERFSVEMTCKMNEWE